ncbi:hypothetical protein [Laspinema olomoucense]|uniref:Uncharacterized protein n=1 Tax=Laspinema olomoucense D3b TaxID=2953688 RepID=A0ABT2N4G8_9CYAN|nr:hypothetical protein [Laspinema sp. D3b]MCT7977576.1 hypothetical protein [Laspinema sp. D3b]
MKLFDPEAIDVQIESINNAPIDSNHSVEFTVFVKKAKTAYFRISPQMRDFLLLCHEQNQVIGFDYDFQQGDLNFGIIVKDSDSNKSDDDATEHLAEEQ